MKPIPTILPIYAALLALFFVYLSLRIIRQRHSLKIGLGDAGASHRGHGADFYGADS